MNIEYLSCNVRSASSTIALKVILSLFTGWIFSYLAGMILIWPSLIFDQMVPVRCIPRSHRLKIDFRDENFEKSSSLKPQGLEA